MINKELTKVKLDREIISKKLEDYTANGIMIEQVEDFNNACRQEFILATKERLLDHKVGDQRVIMPKRIERRITINPTSVPVTKKNKI